MGRGRAGVSAADVACSKGARRWPEEASGRSPPMLLRLALEIGIEPTVRHAADLGIVPVVVEDACGAGHAEAGQWTLAQFRYMGDAVVTDEPALRSVLAAHRLAPRPPTATTVALTLVNRRRRGR